MLGSVLNSAGGGLLSGVTDVAGFGVDTVMKVANFVGLKNMVSIGVTAAGAMGGNEALTFAGIGSLIGGKSTIGTIVGAGAGFAVGSMLQAQEAAETLSAEGEQLAEGLNVDSSNRYLEPSASSSIDDIMQGETPAIGADSEYTGF
jgi:hypothetical protein